MMKLVDYESDDDDNNAADAAELQKNDASDEENPSFNAVLRSASLAISVCPAPDVVPMVCINTKQTNRFCAFQALKLIVICHRDTIGINITQ